MRDSNRSCSRCKKGTTRLIKMAVKVRKRKNRGMLLLPLKRMSNQDQLSLKAALQLQMIRMLKKMMNLQASLILKQPVGI